MASHQPADDEAVQRAAEKLVESRLRLARQDEAMAIYEDLLRTIWDRIVPTLGRVTVCAILDRSISTTAEHYPFLQHLVVTRDGLSFQRLREHLGDQEQLAIRDAMKDLVANLINLLAVLTGDILVRHLLQEVEGGR